MNENKKNLTTAQTMQIASSGLALIVVAHHFRCLAFLSSLSLKTVIKHLVSK